MKKIGFLILCAAYVLVKMWMQLPDERFHVYFLDVGQGDSVLVQTPEGYFVLIDGGPGNTVMEELAEVLPFFVKKIDMVVLSHPHADHMEGLVDVLKRFEVDLVLMSGVRSASGTYEEFWAEARQAGLIIAEDEIDFKLGSVVIDTLYPFESMGGMEIDNLNNASVVMKMYLGGRRFLLTGDLEIEGEAQLVEAGTDLKADILLAGHHGSDTSSTPEFLARVLPKVVVIQCGIDNSYGHPKPETIKNMWAAGVQRILRNDEDGRVEIVF